MIMSVSSPEYLVVADTAEKKAMVNEIADQLRKSFRFGLFDVDDLKEGIVFSKCVDHIDLANFYVSLGFLVMKETWVPFN